MKVAKSYWITIETEDRGRITGERRKITLPPEIEGNHEALDSYLGSRLRKLFGRLEIRMMREERQLQELMKKTLD